MTPRQSEALKFIRGYIAEHGFAPTYREISAALGKVTLAAAHGLVAHLIEAGLLVRTHGVHRALALPRDPTIGILTKALEQCRTLAQDIDHPSARLIAMTVSETLER